ncbi:MAG: flagellin [Methyloprofundus sp.]|nr:flagellin [Methyloprofundus sp.]
MALVINTNMASLNAQRILGSTSAEQGTAMERLTSGLRINRAADDAAGLAVVTGMTTQIRGTDMAIRNANDGISIAQTIDGSSEEIVDILQRVRELGIQSLNDTYSDVNREQMDLEVQQLKLEMDRIAVTTKFNGRPIMADELGIGLQVGWETTGNDRIVVNTKDMSTAELSNFSAYLLAPPAADLLVGESFIVDVGATLLGAAENITVGPATEDLTPQQVHEQLAALINDNANLKEAGVTAEYNPVDGTIMLVSTITDLVAADYAAGAATDLGIGVVTQDYDISVNSINILTQEDATRAINTVDRALEIVNEYRAEVGALQNRLEYTVSNLSNINENMNAARSRVLDADFAKESANLARTQVLQQAGMSMLGQANQQSQSVLSLLQ